MLIHEVNISGFHINLKEKEAEASSFMSVRGYLYRPSTSIDLCWRLYSVV
ncbi:hypothetical protein GECvBGOT_gp003c [Salmonella phage GEC_vB_GOT]|nr:hypothetical protein GECvBGOT_gp003c [Salmonella phage GEC_vB_GOT]